MCKRQLTHSFKCKKSCTYNVLCTMLLQHRAELKSVKPLGNCSEIYLAQRLLLLKRCKYISRNVSQDNFSYKLG